MEDGNGPIADGDADEDSDDDDTEQELAQGEAEPISRDPLELPQRDEDDQQELSQRDEDNEDDIAEQELPQRDPLPALLRRVESATGSGRFLRFSRVTPSVFQGLVRDLNRRRAKSDRVTYFGANRGVLLVKMNAPEHEGGMVTVADGYRDQLVRMGLGARVSRIGTPRVPSIHPNTAAKQPDDGLIPIVARPTGNHFATIVFEVANSQDLRSARQTKDWWFGNSAVNHPRGAVNLVLITHLSHDERATIHFELWRRNARRPRKAAIWLTSADNTTSLSNPMDDPDL